jgi:hypothetical protein
MTPKKRAALISDCQRLVKGRLRAPSLARFTTSEPAVDVGDGKVLVVGEVEAMNGFGGYNRLSYMCRKEAGAPLFDEQGTFVLGQ